MCIEPCIVPEVGPVACRYCWQCRSNRISDLAGRCIAEQRTSSATFAVTLTYRGDVPNAATLVFADVQKFMKKLRKKYDVRYIVAGEYGSKNGRAHWHIVLFFKGAFPTVVFHPDDRKPSDIILPRFDKDPWARIEWAPWEHGHSYFQQPDFGVFYYAMKYSMKDQDDPVSRYHLAMSKKPPLGDQYFRELAEKYVEQGLAPQTFVYSFPDVFKQTQDGKRKRREFYLQGVSRFNFIEHYLVSWSQKHGFDHPFSELILEHEDEIVRLENKDRWDIEEELRKLDEKRPRYVAVDMHDELECVHLGLLHGTTPAKIIEHDDGTLAIFYEGQAAWREKSAERIKAVWQAFTPAVTPSQKQRVERHIRKSYARSKGAEPWRVSWAAE